MGPDEGSLDCGDTVGDSVVGVIDGMLVGSLVVGAFDGIEDGIAVVGAVVEGEAVGLTVDTAGEPVGSDVCGASVGERVTHSI